MVCSDVVLKTKVLSQDVLNTDEQVLVSELTFYVPFDTKQLTPSQSLGLVPKETKNNTTKANTKTK